MRFPTETARVSTKSSSRSFSPRSDVRDFDLEGTLFSGQVFRWRPLPPNGGERSVPAFAGWIGRQPICVRQEGERLSFSGAPGGEIRRFFSLDVDLPALTRRIDVDPVIHEAIRRHPGLRIIRQEPWECAASFLLSAFNNIVRLTGMLERLAPAGPFPPPEALARMPEKELRARGLGYRAPYLRELARRAASGSADLEGWKRLEDGALRERLLGLPGIGEKVAECVMLFGYGRGSAFPVDVWIGRVMRAWYFRGRKVPDRRVREFARRHFGPECGWAQQYLFCRARSVQKI